MTTAYVLAGIVSLGWLFVAYDDGMAQCVKHSSFTTCHHALNR